MIALLRYFLAVAQVFSSFVVSCLGHCWGGANRAAAKRARASWLCATFWPGLKLNIGRELSIIVIVTPITQYLTRDPAK